MVGCLGATQAYTYHMLLIPSSYDNQKCLHTLPNIHLREEGAEGRNLPSFPQDFSYSTDLHIYLASQPL